MKIYENEELILEDKKNFYICTIKKIDFICYKKNKKKIWEKGFFIQEIWIKNEKIYIKYKKLSIIQKIKNYLMPVDYFLNDRKISHYEAVKFWLI